MLEKIYPHKERVWRDSNMSLNLSKKRSRDGKAPKPKAKRTNTSANEIVGIPVSQAKPLWWGKETKELFRWRREEGTTSLREKSTAWRCSVTVKGDNNKKGGGGSRNLDLATHGEDLPHTKVKVATWLKEP